MSRSFIPGNSKEINTANNDTEAIASMEVAVRDASHGNACHYTNDVKPHDVG